MVSTESLKDIRAQVSVITGLRADRFKKMMITFTLGHSKKVGFGGIAFGKKEEARRGQR